MNICAKSITKRPHKIHYKEFEEPPRIHPSPTQTLTSKQKFLQSHEKAAQAHETKGVPPSATIAQAIIESGWGRSKLAKQGFNFFGQNISYRGQPYIRAKDNGFWRKFRKFKSIEHGYEGRLELLGRRYPDCLYKPFKEFVKCIKAEGYAEDPDYVSILVRIYNDFQLNTADYEYKKIITNYDPPCEGLAGFSIRKDCSNSP